MKKGPRRVVTAPIEVGFAGSGRVGDRFVLVAITDRFVVDRHFGGISRLHVGIVVRQLCDGLLKGLGIETTYYDPLIGRGIASLIRSKIYGQRLGREAMECIMRDTVDGSLSELHLSAFVTACAGDNLDLNEMVALTEANWVRPLADGRWGLGSRRDGPVAEAVLHRAE